IPQKGSASVNADAVKTSTGALYNIPVCKEQSLRKVFQYLKQSGIQLVSATEKAKDFIYEADYTVPTASVLGSEEDGISDDLIKISDHIVNLPMTGKTSLLYVSAACGVYLRVVLPQRAECKTRNLVNPLFVMNIQLDKVR